MDDAYLQICLEKNNSGISGDQKSDGLMPLEMWSQSLVGKAAYAQVPTF
jgi:hypothetical protein